MQAAVSAVQAAVSAVKITQCQVRRQEFAPPVTRQFENRRLAKWHRATLHVLQSGTVPLRMAASHWLRNL